MATQHINNRGPLNEEPTRILLETLGQREAQIADNETAHLMMLSEVMELARELGSRAVAPIDMAARVRSIQLNDGLTGIMREGAMPSNSASRRFAHHGPPAGSRNVDRPKRSNQNPSAIPNTERRREPVRTRHWGKHVAAPRIRRQRGNQADPRGYSLRCNNCNKAFRNHQAVFTHFPLCVEDHSNITSSC